MSILVVEDDERITSFLAKGLEAEGYPVVIASNGVDALGWLEQMGTACQLVLLDLGLPGVDGLEVLREMRRRRMAVPVIVVTARDEVDQKVAGLDAGANDYLTKPFSFAELLARIRAALRVGSQTLGARLSFGDVDFDLLAKVAWRAGHRIDLAPREWALLELFLRHPHQIFSRSQILSRVWAYDFDPGSNVVDVYVGYLRRKLNRPGLRPLIRTVRGAGYRLAEPDSLVAPSESVG